MVLGQQRRSFCHPHNEQRSSGIGLCVARRHSSYERNTEGQEEEQEDNMEVVVEQSSNPPIIKEDEHDQSERLSLISIGSSASSDSYDNSVAGFRIISAQSSAVSQTKFQSVPSSTKTDFENLMSLEKPVKRSGSKETYVIPKLAETSFTSPPKSPVLFRPTRTDMKLCCRLIAMHTKSSSLNLDKSIQIYVDGMMYLYQCIQNMTVGCNVNCLVFVKNCDVENKIVRIGHGKSVVNLPEVRKLPLPATGHFSRTGTGSFEGPSQSQHLHGKKHYIFCFNWFNPKNLWDYASLGSSLVLNRGLTKEKFISKFAMATCESFLKLKEMNAVMKKVLEDPDAGLVTFTGFSLGSSVSHAMAYKFREDLAARSIHVRVIAFGGSRPGGVPLTEWFCKNLSQDSLNVMMIRDIENKTEEDTEECDEVSNYVRAPMCTGGGYEKKHIQVDPVCSMPPFTEGFDFQPNLFLLDQNSGVLQQLDVKTKEILLESDEELASSKMFFSTIKTGNPLANSETSAVWDSMHSVIRYYEAMAESKERF